MNKKQIKWRNRIIVALVIFFIESRFDELEVDAHRGEQPLYPIVFSVE